MPRKSSPYVKKSYEEWTESAAQGGLAGLDELLEWMIANKVKRVRVEKPYGLEIERDVTDVDEDSGPK